MRAVTAFAWLAAVGFASLSCGSEFDVQGHRGARGLLPENTLPAFARAIELGVTTLEMDLGVTRDGAVVVAHDPYVNPNLCLGPDGARLEGERGPLLRDLSLAEVQAYDCGTLNPDPERFPEPPRVNVPGEHVPTLRDVFALVRERGASRVRFNVEIKSRPDREETVPLPEFVAKVVEVLRDEGMVDRTTIQAFDWRALLLAKQREPEITTAALLARLDPLWQAGLDAEESGGLLGMLRSLAGSIDILSPHWRMLVPGERYAGVAVSDLQAAGFAVVPWTVNDPDDMRNVLALGVDGLITDYPDRLLRVLAER